MASKYNLTIGLFSTDSTPESGVLSELSGLVDGIVNTHAGDQYWQGNDQYGFNFGEAKDLIKIRLFSASHNGQQIYTTWSNLQVYKSDDNLTWTLVETFDGSTDCTVTEETDHCWWDIVLSAPVAARYFKVYSSSGIAFGSGGLSASVSEIEAYISVTKSKILSIDHTKIDSDLTDFPIAIDLGKHVPDIFSDLGTDNLKFKVTAPALRDGFSGTSIDSVIWDEFNQPDADVTINNELQLNNYSTNAHSGAHIFTKNSYDFTKDFVLTCKWMPHKNSYQSAAKPNICFCNSASSRESNYGERANSFIKILLAKRGSDTTNRTALQINTATSSDSTWPGSDQIVQTIDIDETLWHDLQISWDVSAKTITVDLDSGNYNFNAVIPDQVVTDIGSDFVLELGSPDYSKNNTERFKDLSLVYPDVECPVEIEEWDDTNSKGVIHTKIPFVSSMEDTEITVAWNDSWDDNTDYVGVTGSIPAQNVWDDNFTAVYHMAQDPSGGADCILDSTANKINLTPNGAMTSADLIDGLMGKAIDFDGVDDYLQKTGLDLTELNTERTIQLFFIFNAKSANGSEALVNITGTYEDRFARYSNQSRFFVGPYGYAVAGSLYFDEQTWFVGTERRLLGKYEVFIDDNLDPTSYSRADSDFPSATLTIGGIADGTNPSCITVASLMLSNVGRSDAWIKATNASLKDELFKAQNFFRLQSVHIAQRHIINSNSYLILGGI